MFWQEEETIIFKIQFHPLCIREIDNFWVAWCLCLKARLQKCYAIDTTMILYYHANKTHFHKKGFALSLVWKEGFCGLFVFAYKYAISLNIAML